MFDRFHYITLGYFPACMVLFILYTYLYLHILREGQRYELRRKRTLENKTLLVKVTYLNLYTNMEFESLESIFRFSCTGTKLKRKAISCTLSGDNTLHTISICEFQFKDNLGNYVGSSEISAGKDRSHQPYASQAFVKLEDISDARLTRFIFV